MLFGMKKSFSHVSAKCLKCGHVNSVAMGEECFFCESCSTYQRRTVSEQETYHKRMRKRKGHLWSISLGLVIVGVGLWVTLGYDGSEEAIYSGGFSVLIGIGVIVYNIADMITGKGTGNWMKID